MPLFLPLVLAFLLCSPFCCLASPPPLGLLLPLDPLRPFSWRFLPRSLPSFATPPPFRSSAKRESPPRTTLSPLSPARSSCCSTQLVPQALQSLLSRAAAVAAVDRSSAFGFFLISCLPGFPVLSLSPGVSSTASLTNPCSRSRVPSPTH